MKMSGQVFRKKSKKEGGIVQPLQNRQEGRDSQGPREKADSEAVSVGCLFLENQLTNSSNR